MMLKKRHESVVMATICFTAEANNNHTKCQTQPTSTRLHKHTRLVILSFQRECEQKNISMRIFSPVEVNGNLAFNVWGSILCTNACRKINGKNQLIQTRILQLMLIPCHAISIRSHLCHFKYVASYAQIVREVIPYSGCEYFIL